MLNKLKWRLTRLMYGRYGVDQLYIASIIFFIVLQILQIFITIRFLNIASWALIIWTFYRAFSKNISARQAENKKYLKFIGFIKSKRNLFIRRIKDIGTHRYRKCSECKTILRLPHKRGKHKVHCPKCSHVSQVRIWL